ncbi:hypothetical protein CPB84DRAFT_1746211 [Gymnopilus junonius]|uniref:Uncharacterized protein n=1 Tax=Gymnopilus junonius TaxID=109634 RepID=A0A9P5TPX7_GYMJU|nr:hypothetical protein CPB84DRAFT_1746211 [Gymnopilus junonius]
MTPNEKDRLSNDASKELEETRLYQKDIWMKALVEAILFQHATGPSKDIYIGIQIVYKKGGMQKLIPQHAEFKRKTWADLGRNTGRSLLHQPFGKELTSRPEEVVRKGIRALNVEDNDGPEIQDYIPQHLLPKKLAVHDPWKLLKHMKQCDQDEKEYKDKMGKANSVRNSFLADPHSDQELPEGMTYTPKSLKSSIKNELGPAKPPVYVIFPPKSPKTPANVAHLYLSPEETIGEGHHSFVYRAKLQVPCSLLVEEDICMDCVQENVERILLEEDGPDGSRRDPKWDELSGKYISKKVGKPGRLLAFADSIIWEWEEPRRNIYKGPYRAVATTVGYQNLERAPYCEHFRRNKMDMHPLNVKLSQSRNFRRKMKTI